MMLVTVEFALRPGMEARFEAELLPSLRKRVSEILAP
jgi:hypothetical protein